MPNANATPPIAAPDTAGLVIVYDGDCPFCSSYVTMARLREAAGPVRLVDARTTAPEVAWLRAQGYDLNEGMAMIEGGAVHFGPDCLSRIAALSTESTLFNKVNARLFRSPRLARRMYPVMRAGRNATLALLGRKKI